MKIFSRKKNSSEQKKVLAIVGQTATGKSELAVFFAEKYKGEIISADSRQVYKGLDSGSGKLSKEKRKNIPHHMIDIVDPKKKDYNVYDFQKTAKKKIKKILKRGNLPIVCGGSGFYIDALLFDFQFPHQTKDKEYRNNLEKKTQEELISLIPKKEREGTKKIDTKNKRKLIRRLEILKTFKTTPLLKKKQNYNIFWIGLKLSSEELAQNIHTRLHQRIKKEGMIEEARKLHKEGLSFERMEKMGLEYRYLSYLLQGKLSQEEMKKKIEIKIKQYGKRQKTWFKRNSKIHWFHPIKERAKIESFVKENFSIN